MTVPSRRRLIVASLRHRWRTHLATAAAVAVVAAVLTGALLVGDCMRGSLRSLALDRLGRFDQILLTERFFRAELAASIVQPADGSSTSRAADASAEASSGATPDAQAAILLPATVETAGAVRTTRANRVNLLGIGEGFWRLDSGGSRRRTALGPGEVLLNRPLADRLSISPGQRVEVLARLRRRGAVPEETPLGRRAAGVLTLRLQVVGVVPARGLGHFSPRPTRQATLNAFVDRQWLAEQIDRPGRANMILVADRSERDARAGNLADRLDPTLADYGLRLERTRRGYFNLTSDRLLISPTMERAVLERLSNARQSGDLASPAAGLDVTVQPALTYLANTLAVGQREVPYSTVTAIDFAAEPPLGPFRSVEGQPIPPPARGEIVLNRWAADQLGARVGDRVRLDYFRPVTEGGEPIEESITLRLAAVAAMRGAAANRDLVPRVSGVTDELDMADWDPPFPFDATRIRPVDEDYWDQYGPTPKAFVALETGRRLWGSRYGHSTSLRIAPATPRTDGATETTGSEVPAEENRTDAGSGDPASARGVDASLDLQRLARRLTPEPAAVGFTFQPVRQQALRASAGTTPFGVLFLSFSSFLIAAALMLVALLFRLGVESRAPELGLLAAAGFSRRAIAGLLLAEGGLVAAVGVVVGAALGVGYAALMVLGLNTWWKAAIAGPTLQLFVSSGSLVGGGLAALLITLGTIAWGTRRAVRLPVRHLLGGGVGLPPERPRSKRRNVGGARKLGRWWQMGGWWGVIGLLIVASLSAALIGRFDERARIAGFFGVGTIALVTGIWAVRLLLGRLRLGGLAGLAARNAGRQPTRATLAVALVASATFVIVSVSAFHIDPTVGPPRLDSGSGGFAFYAESTQPLTYDLGTELGQRELGFTSDERELLGRCEIVSLKARPGESASCLNLYQPGQPRLIGVPGKLVRRGGFAWADAGDASNPWRLLRGEAADAPSRRKLESQAAVPMIVDQNVAVYSLHLYGGVGERYDVRDHRGQIVPLEIVATLAGSIFQGGLLISEERLEEMYPQESGYRVFLVDSPAELADRVRGVLEDVLGDYGFAAQPSGRRLAEFLAVQNTYLATFRSLGGLGLLLGTVGLAVLQLRSALERQGELALLRSIGFRRQQLGLMVLLESAYLLLAGLAVGGLAALVAVAPHLLTRQASVPWTEILLTLVAILAVGLVASLLAVRAITRMPLLPALRHERV